MKFVAETAVERGPEPEDPCLVVAGSELVMGADGLLTVADLPDPTAVWCLGMLDDRPVWCTEWPGSDRARQSWPALAAAGEPYGSLAARALSVTAWRRAHRFCGACRSELADVPGVTGRRCPQCGLNLPMALQPVVLVAVRRANRVLLVRHAHAHQEIWALVGGLVEAGETLEEAARREVAEETGLRIADLAYQGSQPYGQGHPGTLLTAFTAGWVAGELAPDPAELQEARWFPVDALPSPLPPPYSIARQLLDALAKQVSPGRPG